MLFKSPINFTDAMKLQVVKTVLPMTLDSAQYRALDADIKRRAVFSSKITSAQILDQLAGLTQDLLSGETDAATAHLHLKKFLESLDNPLSDSRVELMLNTNTATASGFAQFIQANDPDTIDQYPAWELYRAEEKKDPRNWPQRWQTAAAAAQDGLALRAWVGHGRMAALKDSPIWQSLGDSGLFPDGLDNPYPPFAFNSGMYGLREVNRQDTIDLGLMSPEDKPQPHAIPNINEELQASYQFRSSKLQQALLEDPDLQFRDGILTLKEPTP